MRSTEIHRFWELLPPVLEGEGRWSFATGKIVFQIRLFNLLTSSKLIVKLWQMKLGMLLES